MDPRPWTGGRPRPGRRAPARVGPPLRGHRAGRLVRAPRSAGCTMRFTVGNKIGLGFFALIFAIVILLVGDALAERALARRFELMHDRGIVGTQLIGHANAMLHRERGLVYQHLATQDPTRSQESLIRMEEVGRDFRDTMLQY